QTGFGNEKCALRSPWRWPISRRPSRNANSPREPCPAPTPGQVVTSSLILCEGVRCSVTERSLSSDSTVQLQVDLKSSAGRQRRRPPCERAPRLVLVGRV